MTIAAYLFMLVVMAVLDVIWIGVLMKDFYKSKIGFLLSGEVQWAPAFAFYLLFVFGVLYFAVLPAREAHSLTKALIAGALLGCVAYATYDLTNMATVAHWPLSVTVLDIVWGACISSAVAGAGYWLFSFLEG